MTDRSYEYDPVIRTPGDPRPIETRPPGDGRARARLIAVLLVIAGIAGGLFLVATSFAGEGGLFDLPDDGVEVPGRSPFHLESGEHAAWYEHDLRFPQRRDLECAVITPSGARPELRDPGGSSRVTINDVETVLVWEFTTPESGEHTIVCNGDTGRLLIGDVTDAEGGILRFFGGVLVIIVSITVGVVMFKRTR